MFDDTVIRLMTDNAMTERTRTNGQTMV